MEDVDIIQWSDISDAVLTEFFSHSEEKFFETTKMMTGLTIYKNIDYKYMAYKINCNN
jgi:hypothetical protein